MHDLLRLYVDHRWPSFVLQTAVPLMFYGLQHYLSLAGSLIFIPLITVPTMGGSDVSCFFWTCNLNYSSIWLASSLSFSLISLSMWWQKDTANVVSTMLLVSGLTTILHSYFGTRLPLVQGSSFVYLAPALVIMNSEEYRNIAEHVS